MYDEELMIIFLSKNTAITNIKREKVIVQISKKSPSGEYVEHSILLYNFNAIMCPVVSCFLKIIFTVVPLLGKIIELSVSKNTF